jgi:hypothetical protein
MLEQITDSSLYQHMGSTCQNGGCVREKKVTVAVVPFI